LAQRLLRTVCIHCKETTPANQATIDKFNLPSVGGHAPQLSRGTGCSRCGMKGMKGRTAVYEYLPMSEHIKELMMRAVPSSQLRTQAVAEGMVTMRSDAIAKVLAGSTTLEETARVVFMDEELEARRVELQLSA